MSFHDSPEDLRKAEEIAAVVRSRFNAKVENARAVLLPLICRENHLVGDAVIVEALKSICADYMRRVLDDPAAEISFFTETTTKKNLSPMYASKTVREGVALTSTSWKLSEEGRMALSVPPGTGEALRRAFDRRSPLRRMIDWIRGIHKWKDSKSGDGK
jgi:hypothetical protein